MLTYLTAHLIYCLAEGRVNMTFTPQIALGLMLIIPLLAAVIIPFIGKRAPNLREGVTFVAGILLLVNINN